MPLMRLRRGTYVLASHVVEGYHPSADDRACGPNAEFEPMSMQELDFDGSPEDERFRSRFIQRLLNRHDSKAQLGSAVRPIPRVIVQYWHDHDRLPADVRECLDSWDSLRSEGFERLVFDDRRAKAFIEDNFEPEASDAFSCCDHPAMRCDYFRLGYILRRGGFYVDADEVYRGSSSERLIGGHRLKLQPLCYDIPSETMVPTDEFLSDDADHSDRVFYVNNNPLIAPPDHPIIEKAFARATQLLLTTSGSLGIQSTTGPGNLSASLVAHVLAAKTRALGDFEFIRDWELVSRTVWDLSYRKDERNWRHMRRDQSI